MRSKWWFGLVAYAGVVFKQSRKAFSLPWTWNSDQVILILFVIVWLAVLARLATDIFRYGPSAARARWQSFGAAVERQQNAKARLRSILLWVGVAAVLVVYFNLTQR